MSGAGFREQEHPRDPLSGEFRPKPRAPVPAAQTDRLRAAAEAVHGSAFEMVRTTTDRAYIEPISDQLVLVEYRPHGGGEPESREESRRPSMWIATAEDAEAVDGDLSLLLAASTRYGYLNPDGPDVFNHVALEEVLEPSCPGGEHPPLFAQDNRLKALVTGPDFDPGRVVAFDHFDHALLAPGNPRPLNRVVSVRSITEERFDLDGAEAVLASSPWVLRHRRHPAQSWGSDHNPGYITADLKLPDDLWTHMVDLDARSERVRQSGMTRMPRTHLMPDIDTQLLGWVHLAGGAGNLNRPPPWGEGHPDPLGMAAALRTTRYQYPDE